MKASVIDGWLCCDVKASGLLASPVLPDLQGAVAESAALPSEACVSAPPPWLWDDSAEGAEGRGRSDLYRVGGMEGGGNDF